MLFPTKKQWKQWSLPSKLTAIGAWLGIIGIILTIVFFTLSYFEQRSESSKQQNSLSPETNKIIEELVTSTEAIPSKFSGEPLEQDPLYTELTAELRTNPYNIQALIMRGQYCYTNALSFGGKGYSEALQDFAEAIQVDENIADPHFGFGTVYYQLALFDLAKRELYEVYEKGSIRFNQETNLLERRLPSFELFPDERNYKVLKAALDEFQTGQRLQQLYRETSDFTQVFFTTKDIDNRIRSIRALMGFDPPLKSDDTLLDVFSLLLSKLSPGGIEVLFDIVPTSSGK